MSNSILDVRQLLDVTIPGAIHWHDDQIDGRIQCVDETLLQLDVLERYCNDISTTELSPQQIQEARVD